jgi:type II secretory pathway pseudopilin PulG
MNRAAFTMVEMLLVIAIIVLLTVSALNILPAFKKAAVNQGMARLQQVSEQARTLALSGPAKANARGQLDARYGVIVVATPNGAAWAAVFCANANTSLSDQGQLTDSILVGSRIELPASVGVYIGAQRLDTLSRPFVAWTYAPGSGALQAPDPDRNGVVRAALVGVPPPDYRMGTLAHPMGSPGAGFDEYRDYTPVIIGRATTDHPGFSIRSRDETIRGGVSVYSSGIFLMERIP